MDRTKTKQLRLDLADALQQFESISGHKIEIGNATFGTGHVTFKVTVTEPAEDGSFVGPEQEAYDKLHNSYGIVLNRGQSFTGDSGRTWTLWGLKPRSTRYPILATNEAGKVYKLTVEIVANSKENREAMGELLDPPRPTFEEVAASLKHPTVEEVLADLKN